MIYRLPFDAVCRAAIARLQGALGGIKVVDDPTGIDYPYILLASAVAVPDGAKNWIVDRVSLTWEVWTSELGFRSVNNLLNKMIWALGSEPLDLSADEFSAIQVIPYSAAEVLRDYDEERRLEIRRGVLRVEWRIEDGQQESILKGA